MKRIRKPLLKKKIKQQVEPVNVKFELKPKDKSITLRLSSEMLEAIKAKALNGGIDYQKWIRSSLEDALK